MNAEQLWKIYCEKNPQFDDAEARILFTGRGLKKFFDTTWEQAHKQGVANGRALAANDAPADPFSIFSSFFKPKL